MPTSADVVICGAGIAGISAAFYLARQGLRDIVLVDEGPPLELTSSRSTECYRNWWPDPQMLALMNCSIDLLEELAGESGNVFGLNRRGYLYVTADETKVPRFEEKAMRISGLGAGPVRMHTIQHSTYEPPEPEGYSTAPDGADILLGSELLRVHFPGLSERAVAALHARRAGWLSAQQLGMYMLQWARSQGVKLVSGKVIGLELPKSRVAGVRLSNGETFSTRCFVNAAGPYLRSVGNLAGVDLPVHTELHLKVGFNDTLGVVDRTAPLLIWDDPQLLPWEKDERMALGDDGATRWLTEPFPAGAHTRPEGGMASRMTLMLWENAPKPMEPIFPPPLDPFYPEVALRGLATMLPGLRAYFGRAPRPILDGGYYTKTAENRPLVGPMGVEGAYVIGALSGFGIMSACGVGDLLAAHITGRDLPAYAAALAPERYADPAYRRELENLGETGQL
jgi:glycine/D-amino acid oxidase-like deaminating enzyme